MNVIKYFGEDLQIAKAIIRRDELVTYKFFYKQCYPLFKSIYDNYYTDCLNCKEFIDEIYLVVISPSKTTGRCQLENYRGESSLASWLKSACLFYCYSKYEYKERMPEYEVLLDPIISDCDDVGDRFDSIFGSVDIDSNNIDKQDALAILKQMPNKRYSELIRLRYLEEKTNEETAELLGMTMQNYYNKHKLAKVQYMRVFEKEEQKCLI